MTYEFHPVAEIFPLITGDAFTELVADIRQYGLREAIWLYEGRIIDGRNRYRACLEAGVEPQFREWAGVGSLVSFVVSLNLHRRHLSTSQRGLVAAAITSLGQGGDRRSEDFKTENSVLKQDEAAALLGVSVDVVQAAKKVLEDGTSELQAAVESGEVSVTAAALLADLPDDEQIAIVAQGEKEVVKAASKIKTKKKKAKQAERLKKKAKLPADLPAATDLYSLICKSVGTVNGEVKSGGVDWIITDPPYPKEYLPVYAELGAFAARVLKPGGSLICMVGQSYLPEIMAALCGHLNYHWTLAYLTPGGQAVQQWDRKVNAFWKPLLWFVKGDYAGDWIGDVCKSDVNDNDKRFHDCGQSESGMADIIERFTYPGQTVCDPFCGGGTTGIVAVKMNRRFIGIDVDESAIETAKARLAECQK